MGRSSKFQLPYAQWPEEDRMRWTYALRTGLDPFDDCGTGSHLAGPSRRALQASYGRLLGFLASKYPAALSRFPDARIDRLSEGRTLPHRPGKRRVVRRSEFGCQMSHLGHERLNSY
jgi:hypothetical protein